MPKGPHLTPYQYPKVALTYSTLFIADGWRVIHSKSTGQQGPGKQAVLSGNDSVRTARQGGGGADCYAVRPVHDEINAMGYEGPPRK